MDINKASAEELERAFEVDGTRARYLVDYRNKNGGFHSWDEVKQVPGFEDKMVENLRAAGLSLSGGEGGGGAQHGSHSRGSERQSSTETRHAGSSGEEQSRSERQDGRGGIDVNSASPEELESVAQIDGERARYLVDARKRLGRFKSWDQIKQEVPSFEDGMIERLKQAGARIG